MAQIVINGLSLGSLYAMLALSFWLIFVVTRTFHLAHVVTLNAAAYAVYAAMVLLDWPLVAAVGLALVVAVAVGVASERFVYHPIRKHGGEALVIFVASTALLLIGQALLALAFGESSLGVTSTVPSPVFRTDGMVVGLFDVINAGSAIALGIATWLTMRRSPWGRTMRAVQENPQLARFFGFNVPRTYQISFALGSAILVAPATLLALRNGVNPNLGFTPVLIAIIAVIAGGTESQLGAMLAGFLLGLLQNISLLWLPAEWQTVVTFSVLFLILLIRPRGLRAAVEVRTAK